MVNPGINIIAKGPKRSAATVQIMRIPQFRRLATRAAVSSQI